MTVNGRFSAKFSLEIIFQKFFEIFLSSIMHFVSTTSIDSFPDEILEKCDESQPIADEIYKTMTKFNLPFAQNSAP